MILHCKAVMSKRAECLFFTGPSPCLAGYFHVYVFSYNDYLLLGKTFDSSSVFTINVDVELDKIRKGNCFSCQALVRLTMRIETMQVGAGVYFKAPYCSSI